MSDQPKAPTPRREFLGQFAASAIVLAGTACAAPATVTQTSPAPASSPAPTNRPETDTPSPASPIHWDDSWFARLTAKHKAVFEQAEIDAGSATAYAVRY